MTENVVALDIGVVWEPNAPAAVLASDDMGRTALALNPREDDPDQSAVVLVWSGSHYSAMSDPNHEALNGHRLYGKGLETILWIGQVRDSELVAMLEMQNSVHPQHNPTWFADLLHHVVLTREQVVEVVARSFTVRRISGPPREAIMTALEPSR
jgi:hypothetical protein